MAPNKGKPMNKKSSGKVKKHLKSKLKASSCGSSTSSNSSNCSTSSISNPAPLPTVATVVEAQQPAEQPGDSSLGFPLTKQDTPRTLPRYHAVLSRREEEGVGMEDLDQLQLELESLLSAVAIRLRLLQNEIQATNNNEAQRDGKMKAGSPGKKSRSRNKLMENLSKTRDARPSSSKHSKKLNRLAPHAGTVPVVPPDNDPKPTTRKVYTTKNSAPSRFWSSIDPFCAEVTAEHIKMLEEFIHHNNTSLQSLLEIPPLGEHYSIGWALQELNEAQETASMNRQRRKHSSSPTMEAQGLLKRGTKVGSEKIEEPAVPGPFANRLLSALIQENSVAPLHESNESNKISVKSEEDDDEFNPSKKIKLEPGQDKSVLRTFTKSTGGENILPYKPHVVACFERNLRLQLEAQGLLDPPCTNKEEADDEVLAELKRCQDELRLIVQENERELRAMVSLLREETVRQDIRRKLSAQDNEISDIYQKIVNAKQERKGISKTERELAWKAVRDREQLVKSLDALEQRR